MNFKLFILFFLFIPLFSLAQFDRVNINNNQEYIFEGDQYIFIGHATSKWDLDKSSKNGVRNLIKFGAEKNIEIIAGVHGEAFRSKAEADKYFLAQSDVNYILLSEAGQHKISFTNASKVFFAGGNITLCLCEGIRDVIRGSKGLYDQEINLYVVRDAVYDWEEEYDPMKKTSVDQFIKNFIIPSFKCPWQNWYDFPNMELSNIKINTYYDKIYLNSYDLNPDDEISTESLKHQLNIHFILSKDAANYL